VIFSKSYCPYCKGAKDLFATTFPDVQIRVLECVMSLYTVCSVNELTVKCPIRLDLRDDGPEIQKYLLRMTNQRTVPNIFISELAPMLTCISPDPDRDMLPPPTQTRSTLAVRNVSACCYSLFNRRNLTGNDNLQALHKTDGVKALL
jgi:glutaredoxin